MTLPLAGTLIGNKILSYRNRNINTLLNQLRTVVYRARIALLTPMLNIFHSSIVQSAVTN